MSSLGILPTFASFDHHCVYINKTQNKQQFIVVTASNNIVYLHTNIVITFHSYLLTLKSLKTSVFYRHIYNIAKLAISVIRKSTKTDNIYLNIIGYPLKL